MRVLYEDNHVIVVYKESGEIVQADKSGDTPLSELVGRYLKEKYNKPGNVFVGVPHRLDRPVAGLVVLAKTSKALSRLSNMFRLGEIHKTYWAITPGMPPAEEGTLVNWLTRNEEINKSFAYNYEVPQSKRSVLKYRLLAQGDRYNLLGIQLLTGRHHQIRCQLSAMGCPIKGDVKYGAPRTNPGGNISLLSHRVQFIHPVSKKEIDITSPLPDERLWQALAEMVKEES